jgi:hypothetical protein
MRSAEQGDGGALLSRRRFLAGGLATGVAVLLPWNLTPADAFASQGGKLDKYRQPLPVPGSGIVVATPERTQPLQLQPDGDPATANPSWIPVDTRLTPLGDQVRLMTHLHGAWWRPTATAIPR